MKSKHRRAKSCMLLKTSLLLLIGTMLLLSGVLSGCAYTTYVTSHSDLEIHMYCGRIDHLIRDADFSVARLSNGSILLYDETGSLTESCAFEHYDEALSARIKRIERDEFALYFVFDDSGDSEVGIVFFTEEADGILTDASTVERLTERAFWYDTVRSEKVKLP